MAPTWTRRAVFLGSVLSFARSGAACLSAICFISVRDGMRPAANPAWGLPACGSADALAAEVAPWAMTLVRAPDCRAGEEPLTSTCAGDDEVRSRYPIPRPAKRQTAAIA